MYGPLPYMDEEAVLAWRGVPECEYDEVLDARDRHKPEDGTVGLYSEKHLDAPQDAREAA